MDTLHIQFHRLQNHVAPYVLTVYSYTEHDGNYCIEFDGYLYATEEDFPVTCIAAIVQTDSTQPHTSMHALIEISRRELITNTSRYSEHEEDGHEMKICFFPTHRQRIWFRIIEHIA